MVNQHYLGWALVPAVTLAAPAFATQYLTVEQAQQVLFPEAETCVRADVTLSKAQKKEIKHRSGVRQRWDEQAIWKAEQNGKAVGWFIVDQVVGKHEFITYATALSMDGEVLGVEILDYRETHGGEVREQQWRDNFVGKSLEDSFKLNGDIPNISGATLSCRNVMNGVKRLLAFQQVALKNG